MLASCCYACTMECTSEGSTWRGKRGLAGLVMWQAGIMAQVRLGWRTPFFISCLLMAPDSKPENKQGSAGSGIPSTARPCHRPSGKTPWLLSHLFLMPDPLLCTISVLQVSCPIMGLSARPFLPSLSFTQAPSITFSIPAFHLLFSSSLNYCCCFKWGQWCVTRMAFAV